MEGGKLEKMFSLNESLINKAKKKKINCNSDLRVFDFIRRRKILSSCCCKRSRLTFEGLRLLLQL